MSDAFVWPDDAALDKWGRHLHCQGPGCNEKLKHPHIGRPRIYCSERCFLTAYARKRRERYAERRARAKSTAIHADGECSP